MLSILLDSDAEWWVSRGTFERLFETSVQNGTMPARLEEWRHIADGCGGLDLSDFTPADADEFLAALRSTAQHEVERLADASETTPDGSYRVSLQKLLALKRSTE